jgi:hypothetical protein
MSDHSVFFTSTVPATVPLLFRRPRPVSLVALKYNVEPTGVSSPPGGRLGRRVPL